MFWIRLNTTLIVAMLCPLPCLNAGEVGAEARFPLGDSVTLSRLGDLRFRESKFDDAQEAYRAALRTDPRSARAQWGLGRLAVLRSQLAEAEQYFARAFQSNPRDPDIVLSLAELIRDPESRTVLLQNFLNLADPGDTLRREHVAAQLEMGQRIGQRKLAQVTSPNESYHFKLSDFFAATTTPRGLMISASINGSKPVRLLLDTGAEGIYLNERASREMGLEVLTEARVGGLGAERSIPGEVTLARTLSIGNFQLENCVVTIADMNWLPEADGVIGTDVFKDFLVRIDPKRRTLDLDPLSFVPPSVQETTNVYRSGHFLLVQGATDDRSQGYFMVDTGASFTLIASHAAMSRVPSRQVEGMASLRDAWGLVPTVATAPTSVTIAGRQWIDGEALALDLGELSRRTGFEILGVLGFPLLRQSIMSINYRDGLVELAGQR